MKEDLEVKIIWCRRMIECQDLIIEKANKEKARIEDYIAVCESSIKMFSKVLEPIATPHKHFVLELERK